MRVFIILTLLCYCLPVVQGFSSLFFPSSKPNPVDAVEIGHIHDRRQFLRIIRGGAVVHTAAVSIILPQASSARTPGSRDASDSIRQIQDAAEDLRQLEKDWDMYAIIDAEGRAGSTDGARRILGGIAPQAGSAAIDVAKNTPLYRIDVAFVSVRKAVLEGESDDGKDVSRKWVNSLDLDRFEELADGVVYELQKADGNFYSVLFAAKGTRMTNDIFIETKSLVRQGIVDLDEMITLLKDAGAPGLQ